MHRLCDLLSLLPRVLALSSDCSSPLTAPPPIPAQSNTFAASDDRRLPWSDIQPLWVTGLALLIIIPGFEWGAAIIRFFGRGGQRETVEWGVYLSVLVVFPVAALIILKLVPKIFGGRGSTAIQKLLVFFLAAEAALYALTPAHWRSLFAAALLGGMTVVAIAETRDSENQGSASNARRVTLVIVAIASWMGCGALESWSDATRWFTGGAWRLVGFIAVFAVTLLAFRGHLSERGGSNKSLLRRAIEVASIILLVALSFRTNPVLELYHWEAYAGPIQGLRQGGWLLWDNPAQYGILSILLPTLLPGNAWQSFYVFQAICNLVVALLMFWMLRGVRPSTARSLLAFAVTAATIFFRPRTASLILAGQMTPSGGPVRFMWSFVMLALVFAHYRRAQSTGDTNRESHDSLVVWGTAVWLGSILWSAEAAIYCSAIWFPALAIHLLQHAGSDRQDSASRSAIARKIIGALALHLAALAGVVIIVLMVYRIGLGHSPDWMGYIEYALLYGGGFRALPIDPSGSVWMLLIVFFAISTAILMYFNADAMSPALMPLAGAWGGVWAISSYFVSRSHPANLLSIATFIVFAAGVTLSVLQLEGWRPWHDIIRVAMVPVFAVPVILTITHPGFVREISTSQLSYARFTEQIPLMEPSLNDLLIRAGAKPADPVVRIGDGRLMLPAWRPTRPGGPRVVSPYSWLPKQYEIIGTLPASRRQKYIDRAAQHLGLSGWLIHSKKDGIPDFAQQIADISRTHVETRRFENDDWIVSWYQLKH